MNNKTCVHFYLDQLFFQLVMIQNTWTWVAATATTGWHTFLNANSVVGYQIKIWDPGKTFQIKICNPGKTNVRCPSMWTSRTCLRIRECLLEVQVGFMISRYCWWSCIVHPGNYSAYGFEILLSRSLGPFILSVYLPSAMFVMMSWVSFFVPPVSISIILNISLSLHNNCNLWLHRYKSKGEPAAI